MDQEYQRILEAAVVVLLLAFTHPVSSFPIQYSIVSPGAIPAVSNAVQAVSGSTGAIVSSYGYDMMDQSIFPWNPNFVIVAFRRQYGFRSGWFYGYGIFYEVPPFFGFGEVRLGFGINPWYVLPHSLRSLPP
ncbi:hypothetical protein RvY_16448-2 [Ramazzottius varieornatus]|uniref:Uncharacterized protein n=1 Tax=Ramazzottius varieornatus TaxID=947166 RepID=A0A1D1W195_RAMVA|nr:hypothetical protein RvY_16448-2 [Ramazzottius varieornatus]